MTHPEGTHLAGRIEGGVHVLVQRVYYEDTDFSGLVYHARYLHFLERGRTDHIRLMGVAQGALHTKDDPANAVAFVVRHMDIDFKSPARMDDILEIRTTPAQVKGARLVLAQEIRCGERLLITARVTVAVINGHGRARRLPDDLRARFGLPSEE